MGRHPRCDERDSWHHVINRGIARRTLFETEDDIRFFLSRVARAVRRGQLEVHAYCVMTTHFHMLVKSPGAALSAALQAIQNEYVRRFNRRRRRDGTLVRGRFRSKPVSSLSYRMAVVRYIDANPVRAGLVQTAALYPHGSARHFVASKGPPWLARRWIESCLRDGPQQDAGNPRSYLDVFGGALEPGLRRLVERRTSALPHEKDPLDELLHAATPLVRDWMRRKAALADGTRPGIPLVDPESIEPVLTEAAAVQGAWTVKPTRKSIDAWLLARAVLLRELCGTTMRETALRLGRATPTAARLLHHHRRLVVEDEAYAARMAELARAALASCHGATAKP